jgi:O-antigen ligase
MIRTTLLVIYVVVLIVYARRDWFVSLCGAILLMAVVQHPDMPRNVGGIQGLNPWNALMLSVLVSWLLQRRRRGLTWDAPRAVVWSLSLYGIVVAVAFGRMIFDPTHLQHRTTAYLVSEYLVNCIKWVLPGVILYDTCRTRRQITIGLVTVVGVYLLLAIQVIRWMPLEYAMAGDSLSSRAAKIIQNEIGYNRVNMSTLLAGGSWAFVAATLLFKRWPAKAMLLGGALTVAFGQALTAGRTGYAVWAIVGLTFGLLRWRRLLALMPVAAILLLTLLPGVSERLFKGFADRQGAMEVEADETQITSGRNRIWPFVLAEIRQAPLIGHGRLAMNRLGLDQFLQKELGEDFAHPHNAYLEVLLDSGFIGLFLVIPFYALALWQSAVLLMNRSDTTAAAVGGVTLALVLALTIAGAGSQTFYPREGAVGMWAAVGLMLRAATERAKARAVTDRRAQAPPLVGLDSDSKRPQPFGHVPRALHRKPDFNGRPTLDGRRGKAQPPDARGLLYRRHKAGVEPTSHAAAGARRTFAFPRCAQRQ